MSTSRSGGNQIALSYIASFIGGVMSPSLKFRADMEKWQSGAAELENFFVHVQGGISNRPGTQYVAEAGQSPGTAPSKLIPFIFSNTQAYILEFGTEYIRFIANGAYLTNSDGSIYQIASPYAITDVFFLRYTQSADVLTITHENYGPCYLERLGETDWVLQVGTWSNLAGPTGIAAVATDGNAGNTGTTPGISKVEYTYTVTTASDTLNEESLYQDSATVTAYNIGYFSQYGNYNTITWDAAESAEYYNIYRQYAGQYGLIGTTTGLSFQDQNYAPDTTNGPPVAKNPFYGNNPIACGYFQQRRVFAGSTAYPQTVWMSQSANYTNFDVHTPVRDDDAITATIASQEVNAIKHLVSMPDLLVFTGAGIWKVSGGQTGEAITPANFTAVPQIFVGSSDVRPLSVNTDVLFVEGKGSHVRDLQYDYYAQIYTGRDLSVMAENLFYGYTISDWGFAQFPFNLLWACRSDGNLLGMTYLKEQDVWAWHQHSTTNGVFLSVAVIPETNAYGAIEDVAYFLTERSINGKNVYYVERMVTRQLGKENNDITQSWFVDCGLRYTGASVSKVTGMNHLIGQTVSACIDGKGYAGLTVAADGSVTLPVAGETITVGLPIAAHAQTLPLSLGQMPQFARRKRVSKVYASLYNSCGLQVSTNAGAAQYPIGAQATDGDMTSDLVMKIPSANWTQEGQIDFYQNMPLPVTITGVSFDVEQGF
ncbi:hypothetical protein GOB93_14290 [Acetobacter musti]|uniref:Tail tubular protein B n=1 Tax=Acetobacter musti TaxID=864732 RepID=A0ABX0JR55_9PROT|nr:hypothetical protein [Acetobacter musti]NHN85802.1 hypothetical protein [Acetobacter musti]